MCIVVRSGCLYHRCRRVTGAVTVPVIDSGRHPRRRVARAVSEPIGVQEIGRVSVPGRSTNLVGSATAASEGTINQEQFATRPVLRPREILEGDPGPSHQPAQR
jgi:hypothetical protein